MGGSPMTTNEGVPRGMYRDESGVIRCSRCGWPLRDMIVGLHWPCIAPGEFAAMGRKSDERNNR